MRRRSSREVVWYLFYLLTSTVNLLLFFLIILNIVQYCYCFNLKHSVLFAQNTFCLFSLTCYFTLTFSYLHLQISAPFTDDIDFFSSGRQKVKHFQVFSFLLVSVKHVSIFSHSLLIAFTLSSTTL